MCIRDRDHGEGGNIIGASLAGRVLIIDDVISAGTSVRESVEIIRAAGATPCGVVIALDRMERGTGSLSAVQEVERDYGIPVVAVATFDDLVAYLHQRPEFKAYETAVANYRQEYGVATAYIAATDVGVESQRLCCCCLLYTSRCV